MPPHTEEAAGARPARGTGNNLLLWACPRDCWCLESAESRRGAREPSPRGVGGAAEAGSLGACRLTLEPGAGVVKRAHLLPRGPPGGGIEESAGPNPIEDTQRRGEVPPDTGGTTGCVACLLPGRGPGSPEGSSTGDP
ncbi:hypothetical protein NDU88_004706 [Pleurodeles waltl]|uniref:Uncharacterized protein n=1 Tax=Pleurodeles waltl TaxID=8319 RepID=A0AAV7LJ40_PLEWA|nr:hypothetical protein NDU88_004706 [Pleurodeles waltl]